MADLNMLTKLNDICFYVPDLEEAVQFYTEKMGFEIRRRQPGYVEFLFQGTSLSLWQVDGVYHAVKKEHLGAIGHHFMMAINVPTIKDVDELHEELIGRGVECIAPPKTFPFGARAVYFKDIIGNIWEVFAWVEGNGPGILIER
ncbi:VOC family protein [Bacillus sp. FJAT-50079]|uniref:VOC family protein n=1 Tax=Bacillus sp. FJAT-50079 TaxID=2833577 RepID=UPI001BC93216|nr:VOC family protein [Bacillus sp. FJAT-50079]MBS4208207.1 VOC family protein [Bacillus sp. FJAT-50079]